MAACAPLQTNSSPTRICRGVLMIRPTAFAFNEVTAVTNAFQTSPSAMNTDLSQKSIVEEALQEFDSMVEMLRQHKIVVVVVEGNGYPDEVFPNNWLVFFDRPKFATFPMCATTRRGERDKLDEVLRCINETTASDSISLYDIAHGIDYAKVYEEVGRYMEGTGSIVFDHKNKLAYACISPRTDEEIVKEVCTAINYRPVMFTSCDQNGTLVYHTNVLMSIGHEVAIICAESILDVKEREMVLDSLTHSGKNIVFLTFAQMSEFAGNMLMLPIIEPNKVSDVNSSISATNPNDDVSVPKVDEVFSFVVQSTICVCSTRAYASLSCEQKDTIEKYAKLVHSPLPTIETYGGGSARCMMAEFY